MAKSVRMADIAEKLGVSIVTVSKALNGKDGVGSDLRSKILDTAKQMGYNTTQYDSNIDSLVIGIINSYLYLQRGSSFYWGLYERLLNHLSESNNIGVLEVISQNDQDQLNLPKLVQNKKIDGLIIMGPFPENYISMLIETDLPMVMLDSYSARYKLDTVISDGYYGMYLMTDYLIRKGHKNIAFVGTIGETSSITDRFYGYCKAMTEAGLKVTEDMIIPDRSDVGKIKLELSDDIRKFTALVCNCDLTAYEMMKALDNIGIKVPDEISIVGFDNYIISEITPIKVTTYEVNQDRMAKESVKQICRCIRNPQKKREMCTINGDIIERDSVIKC